MIARIELCLKYGNGVFQLRNRCLEFRSRGSRVGPLKERNHFVEADVLTRDTVQKICGLAALQEEIVRKALCPPNRIVQTVSRIVQLFLVVLPVTVDYGALLNRRRVVVSDVLVLSLTPTQPVILNAGRRIGHMCRTAARRVVEDRAVERRVIGIRRRLAPSHREAVVRPRRSALTLVHKGDLICLRVDQVVLNPLGCAELKETAALVDICRCQYFRHKAVCRCIVVHQLVIEVIDILAVQLHIGVILCGRGRCARHQSAVYIALHIGLHLPSRRKRARVICSIDVRCVVLQCIGGRSRNTLLLVDHLVAHIRMVDLHEHAIGRSCQTVLQIRQLVRVQGHLARVTTADFILHRRIAVQVAVIVCRQHKVRIRHREVERRISELAVDARNLSRRDAPGLECLTCAVHRRSAEHHRLARMCRGKACGADCNTVYAVNQALAVRRLNAKLRNLNLARRRHEKRGAVREFAERGDIVSAVRSRNHSVSFVCAESGEVNCAGRSGLPAVRRRLGRGHNITCGINQCIVRIAVCGIDCEHHAALVIRIVSYLIVRLDHRNQNFGRVRDARVRRCRVRRDYIRNVIARVDRDISGCLVYLVARPRCLVIKIGSACRATVLHIDHIAVHIREDVFIARLGIISRDLALAAVVNAARRVDAMRRKSEDKRILHVLRAVNAAVLKHSAEFHLVARKVIPSIKDIVRNAVERKVCGRKGIAPELILL